MYSATRGDKTILATEKMYNAVYKAQGYILGEPLKISGNQDDTSLGKPLSDMTLPELKAEAKNRGIKFTKKTTAPELLLLLEPNMGGDGVGGEMDSGNVEADSEEQKAGDDNDSSGSGSPPGNKTPAGD